MTRVFIGRLAMNARESDVERFLRGYGKVRDISLKRGYGFVEFDDYRDADDAIADLNGKDLLGESVALELARGKRLGGGGGGGRGGGRGGGGGYGGRRPVWMDKGSRYGPPVRTQYRVIVENMSSRTSWQDLKDHLRQVSNAKLTYADAHKKRVGEGSVEFETRDDMADCIRKADNTELGGKKIRLTEDKGHHSSPPRRSSYRKSSRSRSPRSRSPRSRSRSPRSRSRSRSRSPPRKRSKSYSRSKSRSPSRSPVRAQKRSRTPSKSPEPARAASPGDKLDESDE
ncbi:serine/arginine-rich splicing factor 4-like isoform X1 [Oculina patagonica]